MSIFSICRSTLFFAAVATAVFSCSREKEEFVVEEPVSDYLPLQTGKYITYRVDSLVTSDFNISLVTRSYQMKHVVDAQINDNLGRPSYRVYRFRNNANGTGPWVSDGAYFITPLAHQIEVVEDNLRSIRLREPFQEGYYWKGNTYLPENPLESFGFDLSIDNSMGDWDYMYDVFEPTTIINGQTYNDVWTVEQANEANSDPILFPSVYASRERSVEKYSKNLGLVYRQFIMWEYETSSSAIPTYTGFGITMWMIDHN